MTRWMRSLCAAVAAFWLATMVARAEIQLSAVQFPERSGVSLKLLPTQRVSSAEGSADVKFRDGQAKVEVDYKRLPPADPLRRQRHVVRLLGGRAGRQRGEPRAS